MKLVLDATTKTITAVMSGAAATTNPDFTVAYADNNGTTFTEGANDGAFNGTSSVTLCSAPASSTRRVINSITIENKDTAAVTITIYYNNNATLRNIAKVTLQVGDTWTTDGQYDTNGNLKTVAGIVNLSTQVTGTLPVANGGTGKSSVTAGALVYGAGTSALTELANGTQGYVLTAGASAPTWGGISGGTF